MPTQNLSDIEEQKLARLRDTPAGDVFVREEFVLGIILGLASGIWSAAVHKVLAPDIDVLVLLAIAGAGVGLLSVTLAAMALVTGFLRDFYGDVIEAAGIESFFRPFKVVAVLSAGAAIVGFAAAMDTRAGPRTLREVLFGISVWWIVWAIVGALRLVFNFVLYAEQEREIRSIGDDEDADENDADSQGQPVDCEEQEWEIEAVRDDEHNEGLEEDQLN